MLFSIRRLASSLVVRPSSGAWNPNAVNRSLSRPTNALAQQQHVAKGSLRAFSTAGPVDSIRNIAIIAHVDHGKTTLVDSLLSYNSEDSKDSNERVMDYNDLEKERGITILSKVTSLNYDGRTINIVDTPGHADFGGEVERILSMVDGVCLLVDAFEGPMAQTKYVLKKALGLNLRPIVIINKVDRPATRIVDVENELFDLFCSMDCTDEQLDYKILYSSGRQGWATPDLHNGSREEGMIPLLDAIVKETPPPQADTKEPFKMLVSIMESDTSIHLGKMLVTGRVVSGEAPVGARVKVIDQEGNPVEEGTLVKVLTRDGVSRRELPVATAGNIVTVAGLEHARVTHTVCDGSVSEPVPSLPIDPPTISMFFSVNDSPMVGKEGGKKLTTQVIKERLEKEAESNVCITVTKPESSDRDSYEVHGRGEMQLGILVENMRREGYEVSVSTPQALLKHDEDGNVLEPAEEIMVDCAQEHVGFVMEAMVARHCNMMNSEMIDHGRQKMEFVGPSRGLLGFRNELTRNTRGDAIVTSLFHGYIPHVGKLHKTRKGVMISMATGTATAYTLASLEARGQLFISPGEDVYSGQIIGEHNKENDIEVNPTKAKALTNMRAAGKEDTIKLTPPIQFQLEDAIGYIESDELVEATPQSVRMRKKHLDPAMRKKYGKK